MTMTQLTHRLPQQLSPNVATVIGGRSVPVIAYDDGRSALSVGHVETTQFLRDAEHVFTAIGTFDDALEAQYVIRRHALIRERSNGTLVVLFRVTSTGDMVTEHTPGAVPVTLIEN
jgi:hypothetical protein